MTNTGPVWTNEFHDIYVVPTVKDRALKDEIIAFWQAENALGKKSDAEARAHDVLTVCRVRTSGQIAAVASAYLALVPQLHNQLWHFRCFVGAGHRQHHLSKYLYLAVLNVLAARHAAGEAPQAVGLIAILENATVGGALLHGIRPESRAVYIGDDTKGHRQYVNYFEGAKLKPAARH